MADKLKCYWGRPGRNEEKTLLFDGPNGPDRRLLANALGEAFIDELRRRGYDVTTLKFSVERPTRTDGRPA